ncbi:uncharacterized protein N0V89_000439 [Didymosphaeria variabile]|uniref:RING-type domain-containing protein n=1 Tax=Didymosphaeria variabile TaxID=1932322 RepID=A0A9W9CEY3_9PLEO|nr:uncharacterized protein N0V89_000439 [Didymosphaeria variabile]KAJ4359883.1 hypothetical protein N0V89_000439 [Didymosphaeria variabile]
MSSSPTTMEDFIRSKLQPSGSCIICTDPFSADHQPVALQCHHIFGHNCIKKWLHSGRGANNSCPVCRREVYAPSDSQAFTSASIWTALCASSPNRIHAFMIALWSCVTALFADDPTGNFTICDLLGQAVIPALSKIAGARGAFHDCHALILSSWNSLGRPNTASGLAIPLVRLARMMTQTSGILPKWITTVQRTSLLFWRANTCLGTTSLDISWAHLREAAHLTNPRYFPLLHLYTVLLSQNIVHSRPTHAGPTRTQILDRCCNKIGGGWAGQPSEAFKESVVGVYDELRRHQLDEKRISLRGHEEEKGVVTGLWAMAGWRREDGGKGKPVIELRKKVSGGWSD